jgi:acyl-CoA hydrolase
VITEHGVAYLHGKTIRQRAEAMIAIAHPRFQNELEEYAVKSRLLTPSRAMVVV